MKKVDPRSTIDEEREEEEEEKYNKIATVIVDNNDPNASIVSLSDTDYFDEKVDVIKTSPSSNTTRAGSRANSNTDKKIDAVLNLVPLPTSDSEYYASMSSAPAGFSISYHKHMAKGNDNRESAAIGHYQQHNKKETDNGANQLMVCYSLYNNIRLV